MLSYRKTDKSRFYSWQVQMAFVFSKTSRFLGAFAKLEKRLLTSSCLSVRPSAWNNSAPIGRILWNLIFKYFVKICRENSSLDIYRHTHTHLRRISSTLYEDEHTVMTISVQLFLEWGMFQTKIVQKIRTLIYVQLFSPESRGVFEIMRKKYGRARQVTNDNKTRCTRFVFWITKATDTHPEYAILTALPRHQWLRKNTSILRYTYIASHVYFPVGPSGSVPGLKATGL